MRFSFFIFLLLFTSIALCDSFQKPVTMGTLQDSKLNEVSGIAASRQHKDVYWVHNDSGDGPYIYALHSSGKLLGTVTVQPARSVDWEDIACGTFQGKKCLFVGDIGDNDCIRDYITVYILPEPDIKEVERRGTMTVTPLRILNLVYPDGPRNAEALAVDARGNLIICEKKEFSKVSIYGISPSEMNGGSSRIPLRKIISLDLQDVLGNRSPKGYLVTGGDISPSGKFLVLRGYSWAAEFPWPSTDLKKPFSLGKGEKIKLPKEKQGEAICYVGEDTLVITSEGVHQPIYSLRRKK